MPMFYPEDNESEDATDNTENSPLVLDGTVNLDYSDDDQTPRIKGLIELLNQYLGIE